MATNFKRHLAVSLSVILGSVVVAAALLSYLSGEIATQAVKIADERSVIYAETRALASISALKAQAPRAAIYGSAMEKLLPVQDGLITFSQWIREIAIADRVTATPSFQGSNVPASENAFGQAGFSLDVLGLGNDVVAFLRDIEAKTPGFLMSLSSFDLVQGSSGYHLTAQGTLFFRQQ